MRLTNYWWLLIWLFIGGAFFALPFPKKKELVCGKTVYRWGWMPAMGLMLPYLMWAIFRYDFGDTLMYLYTFKNMPESLSQIGSYMATVTKDKGFTLFSILIKVVFGHSNLIYLGIIALIQIWCIVRVFRKYSPNYWISVFLFIVSTDYLSWMHNGMRQFLAVTLIFAGFDWLLQKKYVPLILLILLASTIHGSALIMLPIIFVVQGKAMNKKTVLTVLAMLLVVLMIDRFTPFLNELLADTQYNDMINNEIWAVDDGTNPIRVLVYSVPALLAIVGYRYVRRANDPVMNICVNCSLITMGLYAIAAVSSGIYIGRLPIYTTLMGYISLPWLIDEMFVKKSAQFVKAMMVLMFLVFFYFQMHFIWRLL